MQKHSGITDTARPVYEGGKIEVGCIEEQDEKAGIWYCLVPIPDMPIFSFD